MAYGCGGNCMKYSLVFFNVLFLIIGLITVGVGIWALVDGNFVNTLSRAFDSSDEVSKLSILESAAVILIVGGIVIFIIAFLGCCGAWKEIRVLLGIYIFCLILILVFEIVVIVLAAIFKTKMEEEFKNNLVSTVQKHYTGNPPRNDFTKALDNTQQEFRCCGINDYRDFTEATQWIHVQTTVIPDMCCRLTHNKYPDEITFLDDQCTKSPNEKNSFYKKGCYDSIRDAIIEKSLPLIILGAIIIAIEIIGIVFAICLCIMIKREKIV